MATRWVLRWSDDGTFLRADGDPPAWDPDKAEALLGTRSEAEALRATWPAWCRGPIELAPVEVCVTPGACSDCGDPLPHRGTGKPAVRCPPCYAKDVRAKDRLRARARLGIPADAPVKKCTRGTLADAVAALERKAAARRRRSSEVRRERKAAGLCALCGKAPGANGTQRCEPCKSKRRQLTSPAPLSPSPR